VRATKFGWFELDAQQTIVKDVVTFLSQPSCGVYLLGLKILEALVGEMNTPSSGYSLIAQRKTAVSFRDASLLTIFTVGLTSLRQLSEQASTVESPRLTEAAVLLLLKCLSFDFVGTSMDESAEEVGTIQVPSSWRASLEEPRTMALFLSTYAASQPPLSSACLECLVRLASVRRSLFATEAERASFLARLLHGTAEILRVRTGLTEHANYHEFCRLLGRLKTNYQLSELVSVEGWQEWIALVADFTLTSLQSWQWAAGSVYYLLSLWSRLVASVPYLKGDAPSTLDAYVPRITETYITTRLESVSAVAAAQGEIDDPLAEEEALSEQLESLPQLCRFQYEATCAFLCSLLDPRLARLAELGAAAAGQGGAAADAQLGVLEGQLAWLVHIIGSVIRGRLSSASAESQEAVDGELALRVFQLLRLTDGPGHCSRTAEPRQRLELAIVGFFQNFRKVYVGEQCVWPRLRCAIPPHSSQSHPQLACLPAPLRAAGPARPPGCAERVRRQDELKPGPLRRQPLRRRGVAGPPLRPGNGLHERQDAGKAGRNLAGAGAPRRGQLPLPARAGQCALAHPLLRDARPPALLRRLACTLPRLHGSLRRAMRPAAGGGEGCARLSRAADARAAGRPLSRPARPRGRHLQPAHVRPGV